MTPRPLDTIAAAVRTETVVLRSRFVAALVPVADQAAAEVHVAATRRALPDAGHHATALVLGADGGWQRSNDDGEPAGTAGAPMLAVLDGAGLTDVLAIVTRYFGGTLLGAGGLVRAYGGAVTEAVAVAQRRGRQVVEVVEVRAAHDAAGRLEHRLRTWADGRLDVADGRYTAAGASFEVAVPEALLAGFHAMLAGGGIAHELEALGSAIRSEG